MFRLTLMVTILLITGASIQAQSIFKQDSASCEYVYGENLGTWPYFSASLPWEVMATYVVADTLCRLYTEEELTAIAAGLSNDSLIIGFKALIKAQDYNYFLFRHIQSLSWKIKPVSYKIDYGVLQNVLEKEYFLRIENPTVFDTIRQSNIGAIIFARVLNTEMHLDSTVARFGSSKVNEVYCADVEIIYSIFGASNVSICEGQGDGEVLACLHLTWSCPKESEFSRYYPEYSYYEYGPGRLVTNKEYIIFTDMWMHTIAPNSIKYYILPVTALPVTDNTVHDIYNILGLGENISLSTFIQTLRNGIIRSN